MSRVTRHTVVLVVGIVAGMIVLAGCGDNKFEEAYETAKTLSSDGTLSDTEAAKYYEASEELLREIAGLKIKAQRRHLYVLEGLLDQYENLETWPKVIETAQMLVDRQPTKVEWYIRLGRANVHMSTVDQSHRKPAERAFMTALEIEPRSLRAHYGLGLLYGFHMDKPREARDHLRTAAYEIPITVKNQPEVIDARFALGKLEYEAGRLEQAEEAFNSILELDSVSSESKFLVHKNLGDLYRRRGSADLAKQHYQQSYNINPVDSTIRQRLRSLGVTIDDRFNRFESN